MRVGVNAFFLAKPQTGSGRYVRRLLDELARLGTGDEFVSFGAGSWELGAREGTWGPSPQLLAPSPIARSEDLAKVISLNENVSVPAGNFQGCLMIGDWSPIEPDDVTTKFYYPSVGLVMEVERTTGDRLELVQVIN